jgi:DNA-binding winged helix-turn-helix (wHTH) protein/Tfp pilus assembly protein PilF
MVAKTALAGLLTLGHSVSLDCDMVTPDQIDLAHASAFRLGPITVEPALRQVTNTRSQTLEPRVMQVLVVLAMANGRIVSRDDMVRSCWEGRIVGDDSITRVIARLRKLAEEHGDGAFRIETITKVGYRLVGPIALITTSQPEPLKSPLTALNDVAAFPAPSAPKPRFWKVAIVGAMLAASIIAIAFWPRAHGTEDRIVVNFAGYKPLSNHIATGLPDAIADATVSAFTEDGRVAVASGKGAGEFRLGGSIDAVGDSVHVASRIDNMRTGTVLWSHVDEIPSAQFDHIAKSTAASTVGLTRCALSQRAIYGRPLTDRVLTLLFAECAAEMSHEANGKALDLARQITEIQPDLASGWSSRAFVANGLISGDVPAVGTPGNLEARAAVAKALAIDPRDSRAWHVKVYLTPSTDLPAIDRAYQAALRARLSECGCVFMDYGKFLLDAGRPAEALRLFQRAHDIIPLNPGPLAALGRVAAGQGRFAEAKRNFDLVTALSPNPMATSQVIISNALWTRDYRGALRLIAEYPLDGPPALAKAIENGFRALESGDGAARKEASADLIRQRGLCDCNGTFELRMMAALGETKAAFDGLAMRAEKAPFHTREAVSWDPIFSDVRHNPGFPALAEKLGLVGYWRAMKVKPDFCSQTNPPALCTTLTNTS